MLRSQLNLGGESVGGSEMVYFLTLQQEYKPDHVVISLNVRNAYNEMQHADVMEVIWDNVDLRQLFIHMESGNDEGIHRIRQ